MVLIGDTLYDAPDCEGGCGVIARYPMNVPFCLLELQGKAPVWKDCPLPRNNPKLLMLLQSGEVVPAAGEREGLPVIQRPTKRRQGRQPANQPVYEPDPLGKVHLLDWFLAKGGAIS